VVSDLSVLSPDKVTQEIMIDHLRELGLTIVSASESDHNDLLDEPDDHTRLVVRDVIAKVGAFRREFADPEPAFDKDIAPVSEPVGADVIVQLMPQGSQLDDRAAHTARPTA
jgi:hypothetical protein